MNLSSTRTHRIRFASALFLAFAVTSRLLAESPPTQTSVAPGRAPNSANPLLPGYYADPTIVAHKGRYYIYATLDPWGGETLGCWESDDLKNWTYRVFNWPTKKACTSPTSKHPMVWAPSVVRAPNGKFYMYVSVGSEVWVGTADHPLGPWKNALGDRPLIPVAFKPDYHMIDAEAFVDDDGTAWLYWGSGWNWVNGRCWAVRLKPDMVTFDGEVHDVTPAHYFEGPFMLKRDGHYYLMYSQGRTTEESYQIHYAIGDNPLGPFTEASNSPILVTDKAANVISPGHHAVFKHNGKHYILYHRHAIPFKPGEVHRQVCVDELRFTPDGLIEKIVPTHIGPELVRASQSDNAFKSGTHITASSQLDEFHSPESAIDANYSTRWAPAADDKAPWLQIDFEEPCELTHQELRPEYAWKPTHFRLESSEDGKTWTPLANHTISIATGSPIVIDTPAKARHLRLAFPAPSENTNTSIIGWTAR